MNTTLDGSWTWPDVKAVMRDLRKSGIECGETAGGIWVYFDLETQGAALVAIVKSHKGRFCSETFTAALQMENASRVIRERQISQLKKLLESD